MSRKYDRKMYTFDPGEMPPGSALYGDSTLVALLFENLNSADTQDPYEGTSAVTGHSRRQYPGDSSRVSVGGHSRTILKGVFNAGLQTLPGEPFTVEIPGPTTNSKKIVYQFTLKGPFTTFFRNYIYKYRVLTEPHILRSPGGKPYAVGQALPGPGV